jgi:hypothetical protein
MTEKKCIKCKESFEADLPFKTICKRCYAQMKEFQEAKDGKPAPQTQRSKSYEIGERSARLGALNAAVATLTASKHEASMAMILQMANIYAEWILTGSPKNVPVNEEFVDAGMRVGG